MQLKKLEIKGFKSFANETILNFEEDVIGIVGPNGSGKSNVVDAIRWVLGEQKSKELRLERMTDIIFNGTKKKKQAGVAQVTLTFENTKNILPTDYQTVAISRVLYRSGESEYRLNGIPCRLKDITALFLDTGIGSNSYAIIALGMVDDILADKENARRKMFEQAAGISKYKNRKKQTLNKLKNTTNDLDRVEDLLFEIEGNLKDLEKQAKRTQKFFELKDKYKTQTINLSLRKVASFKDAYVVNEKKLTEEQDRYNGLHAKSQAEEAKLEQFRKENLDKEKSVSEFQLRLNETVNQIRDQENEKNILEQKILFIDENGKKLLRQVDISKDRVEQLQQEIQDYKETYDDAKQREETYSNSLATYKEVYDQVQAKYDLIKSDVDQMAQQQQTLERELFELEKSSAISQNSLENLKQELALNETEQESKLEGSNLLNSELNTVLTILSEKQTKLAELQEKEIQRKENEEKAELAFKSCEEDIQKINRKLDAKQNEHNLLKSLIDKLEGFPESIKFLSKNAEWGRSAPLLSDIIYCAEEYRVVIENYLEQYLNYYVVETMDDAAAAISLLSKSQKGKAKFFVLEAFDNYFSTDKTFPGAERAIEKVEVDGKYRVLVNYLLRNVFITEQVVDVLNITEEDVVVLSKQGNFIKGKYSIAGGSIGLFEGKRLGRKKNLEMLIKEIARLEEEKEKLEAESAKAKEAYEGFKYQLIFEEIDSVKLQMDQINQQKVQIQTKLENIHAITEGFEVRKKTAGEQIYELNEKLLNLKGQITEKQGTLSTIQSSLQTTDGQYTEITNELSRARNEFNDHNIEFIKQQNKVESIKRELAFRENQLVEQNSVIARDEEILTKEQGERSTIKSNIEDLEQKLLQDYAEKESRAGNLTEAEQKYYSARSIILDIEEAIRNFNKQKNESQFLINELKDAFSETKFKMSSISERLKIEFDTTLEEVMGTEIDEKIPLEELEVKVERLKKRLGNYGEINPMALEAFEEMQARYESISDQRNDILAAKESLLETIKEIEETATTHFMEAFTKAREYFIEVFRSLFSDEDSCDLILVDPTSPLDSPIDIIAKPKGKRPKTLSQLSGGEKTLTATALLFSLYLLKPAPFCIFDEVDAPLDDANIQKFNKIIKKFSKDSQFIIVTHNKQTMAAMDVIYGVFMQEQGISQVSEVDFRNFKHIEELQTIQ